MTKKVRDGTATETTWIVEGLIYCGIFTVTYINHHFADAALKMVHFLLVG